MAAKKIKKKTHKGLAKRFKVTGTGKVRNRKANAGHLQSSKNAKRRRRLRGWGEVEGTQAQTIKEQIQT